MRLPALVHVPVLLRPGTEDQETRRQLWTVVDVANSSPSAQKGFMREYRASAVE